VYAIVRIVVQKTLKRDEKKAYQQARRGSEGFDPRSVAA